MEQNRVAYDGAPLANGKTTLYEQLTKSRQGILFVFLDITIAGDIAILWRACSLFRPTVIHNHTAIHKRRHWEVESCGFYGIGCDGEYHGSVLPSNCTNEHLSQKAQTVREAAASVRVCIGHEAFTLVKENQIEKGDVLTVSKIAGIMAAKQTSSILPLCHPINLSHVEITFSLEEIDSSIRIKTKAKCSAGTGVEMEALMAAGVAALNVIDMIKAVNKSAVITDLQLDYKSGGKSGTFIRT